jgi:hypothetical protein
MMPYSQADQVLAHSKRMFYFLQRGSKSSFPRCFFAVSFRSPFLILFRVA